MASQMECDALAIGTLLPGGELETAQLRAGEVRGRAGVSPCTNLTSTRTRTPKLCLEPQVGFLHGAIKSVDDARVGDTITLARDPHPDGALPANPNPNPSPNPSPNPNPIPNPNPNPNQARCPATQSPCPWSTAAL